MTVSAKGNSKEKNNFPSKYTQKYFFDDYNISDFNLNDTFLLYGSLQETKFFLWN